MPCADISRFAHAANASGAPGTVGAFFDGPAPALRRCGATGDRAQCDRGERAADRAFSSKSAHRRLPSGCAASWPFGFAGSMVVASLSDTPTVTAAMVPNSTAGPSRSERASARGSLDQLDQTFRREDAVALGEQLRDLAPVGVGAEHESHVIAPPPGDEERVTEFTKCRDLRRGRPEGQDRARAVGRRRPRYAAAIPRRW